MRALDFSDEAVELIGDSARQGRQSFAILSLRLRLFWVGGCRGWCTAREISPPRLFGGIPVSLVSTVGKRRGTAS